MTEYWFKPHTRGYGATPANWKGWAVVALFVAVILVLSLSLITLPAEAPSGAKAWQFATWAILVGVLTLAFIRFCRSRTDGEWAWRWGGRRSGDWNEKHRAGPNPAVMEACKRFVR